MAERFDGDLPELVMAPLEALGGSLQQLHRGFQHLIGAPAPLLPGSTGRLELGRVPAGPHPVDVAAAGEVLEGGDLLGQHHRIVGRQHQHRGPQLDPAGYGGGMAERHQRLGPTDSVEAAGSQEVVGDEQRFEAQLLGP